MTLEALQDLCEAGQERLMRMDYLAAETALAEAEDAAWAARDWDTLARLYMPLQEARRQRRQRCGEGTVRLDLLAGGPDDPMDADWIVRQYPHGQLLVAGWGSVAPALAVRRLQAERGLFVETYLAAVYPVAAGGQAAGRAVVVVPTADVTLPDPSPRSIDALLAKVPPQSVVLAENELPAGERRGDTQTFATTMNLWERLHAPFLAAADTAADPLRRMDGYRRTIRVDYGCELAHQKLSAAAREMIRRG